MSDFWGSGLLLAGAVGNVVSVWNPALGTSQDIQPQESVNTLQWSANNKVLAMGGNHGSVALYSAGQYLGSLPLDTMKPADMDEVTCARFSRDSKLLHTGSNSSCIYTWDLKQQAEMGAFREHKSPVTSLAVALNDEYLASASMDGTLLLHMPGSARSLAVLASADAKAPTKRCLCFSPIEQGLLAAACDDSTVSLWSTRGGRPQQHVLPIKHADRVTGVALSYTNPSLLYSCGVDRQLLAIDRRTGSAAQQAKLTAPLTSLALCDNELYLAAGAQDGRVFVTDVRKMGGPTTTQLRAGSPSPVSELHWQSTVRASRRASQAHTLQKPQPSASGAAGAGSQAIPTSGRPSMGTAPPQLPKPSTQSLPSDRAPASTPPPDPQSVAAGPPSTSTPPANLPSSRHSLSGTTNPNDQQPSASSNGGSASKRSSLSGQPPAPASSLHAFDGAGSASARTTPPPSTTSPLDPAFQSKPRLSIDPVGNKSAGLEADHSVAGMRGLGGSTSFGGPSSAPSPRPKPGSTSLTPGGSSTGGPRINMLTEGMFKAYMDEAMATLREDVRNLHIEMLKQFHVQQMEVNMNMLNIASSLQTRQDSLGADMRAIKLQLESIMRNDYWL